MVKSKLKIGIIGCGAIGSFIAKSCQTDLSDKVDLAGVNDIDKSKALSVVKKLKKKTEILGIDELIKRSDLLVEAASKEAAESIARNALSAGKSVMVMSVGGLLGNEDLFQLAEKKGSEIFIPSGAIAGLDALKAASTAGMESIILTTTKPKRGLEGAPYIIKNKIDLAKLDRETVIFQGSAREAIEGFPKNVNVAAILSLAGVGPEKTRVKIVCSPSIERNIHEIQVVGNFGTFSTRTENVPFPENPKTSFLAALSAVATLRNIASNFKIGT